MSQLSIHLSHNDTMTYHVSLYNDTMTYHVSLYNDTMTYHVSLLSSFLIMTYQSYPSTSTCPCILQEVNQRRDLDNQELLSLEVVTLLFKEAACHGLVTQPLRSPNAPRLSLDTLFDAVAIACILV
jgi:hypothetical protein